MEIVKKKIDFTNGKVFFKILYFILPIVATNLLQVFYNAADMMVVSLSSEANAKAAIGVTVSFLHLIVNSIIGFSVGTNVVVARAIGSKDDKRITRAVHTSVIMSVLFGGAAMIFGVIVARPILKWMGATGNLLELAVTYTFFYFLGVPFMAMTNYLSSIFRAKGDSKTPLLVLSSAGVLNVLCNLFFVLVLGLSVEGVAIATAIANAVSAIVLLAILSRAKDSTKFSFKKLKIHRGAFRDIIVVGLPAGVQSALFSLSNVLIQSSIIAVNNSIVSADVVYQPVVDGNAAAANLDGFVYTSMNAVTQGALTFTSQNMGAKKPQRVRRIMWASFGLVTAIGLLMGGLTTIFLKPLLSLYGIAPSAQDALAQIAYETAHTRCMYICLPYFVCGLMEIAGAVLRGIGKSLFSAIIALVGACLLRVVWLATAFAAWPSLETIYIIYPISQTVTAVFTFIVVEIVLRKILKAKGESVTAE